MQSRIPVRDSNMPVIQTENHGQFAVSKDLKWLLDWDDIGDRWRNEHDMTFGDDEVIAFPPECRTPSAAKQRIQHMRLDAEIRGRENAIQLLCEPDLWSIVDQELAVKVREDSEGRQAAFAIMLTAFLEKPANLMLLGSTAIGKTWLAKQVSAFLPSENVVILGSSTQRAWFYCGEPVYKPHPVISGKQIIDYYMVDWTNKVVVILDNVKPETLKDLKPTMSHDQKEIDLQTTEKTQAGHFRTRRVKTVGAPAFVNCSTWLQWDAELTSRHFYLTPKDDPAKYEAAAQYLDQEYTTGLAPTSRMVPIIQEAIRYLLSRKLQIVIHPNVIQKLKEKFTWKSGRDVRDYERAATVIQAIAWFHALQRERNEQGQVIADERDLEIMKRFIQPLLKTSRFGTSGQVLDYYERVLKPLSASDGDIRYDIIRGKYLEVYGRQLTREDLQIMNRALESLGLIELVVDPTDGRRRLVRLPTIQQQL